MGQREIADKLGYSNDVFSRLKSDASYGGSKQLLAAVELLKEVIELRNQLMHSPRDFVKELEVMRGRIDEMQRLLVKYPETKDNPYTMNERSNSDSAAVDAVVDKVAELVQEKYPPKKKAPPVK